MVKIVDEKKVTEDQMQRNGAVAEAKANSDDSFVTIDLGPMTRASSRASSLEGACCLEMEVAETGKEISEVVNGNSGKDSLAEDNSQSAVGNSTLTSADSDNENFVNEMIRNSYYSTPWITMDIHAVDKPQETSTYDHYNQPDIHQIADNEPASTGNSIQELNQINVDNNINADIENDVQSTPDNNQPSDHLMFCTGSTTMDSCLCKFYKVFVPICIGGGLLFCWLSQ